MELPKVELNDGNSVPAIGFGTGTAWYKDGGKCPLDSELVKTLQVAVKHGFHHIDGAEAYGTEENTGLATKALRHPRDQLFIISKVQDNVFDIPKAIDQTLSNLQLEFVDLYMIHWPYFAKNDSDLQTAWKEMEKVQAAGKAKSIGVSNCLRPHLEATLKGASVIPAVNQIEHHPYLQRANGYVPWMQSRGILVEAFKPMVPVTLAKDEPLCGSLTKIAKVHDVPVDAVLLRWQMQQGIVPIMTTRHVLSLAEYEVAVKFELSGKDMEEITEIGLTHHFRAWMPDLFAPDDRS